MSVENKHYSTVYNNLPEQVKNKAVDIRNALLEQHIAEDAANALGIKYAKNLLNLNLRKAS